MCYVEVVQTISSDAQGGLLDTDRKMIGVTESGYDQILVIRDCSKKYGDAVPA